MNLITKVFKLYFSTPIHIGTSRADYTESEMFVHSDTLYAAITQMLALLGEEEKLEELERQQGATTFALSSMFPFTKNDAGQFVYFLPRPQKRFSRQVDDPLTLGKYVKRIKKIQWMDVGLFKRHVDTASGIALKKEWLQEQYLCDTNIDVDFLFTHLEPKVSVGRFKQETDIYYLDRLYFKEKLVFETDSSSEEGNRSSGFYFIFKGTEEDFNTIKKAINLLQYEGLGSDRNNGNGKFEVFMANEKDTAVFDSLVSPLDTGGHYSCNLSLFSPDQAFIKFLSAQDSGTNLSYQLIRRGGWITTFPFEIWQKKSVFMFGEGSIFPKQKWQSMQGETQDITPNIVENQSNKHPIYRTGKSLFVPVKYS